MLTTVFRDEAMLSFARHVNKDRRWSPSYSCRYYNEDVRAASDWAVVPFDVFLLGPRPHVCVACAGCPATGIRR